jgi:hypothetical protein
MVDSGKRCEPIEKGGWDKMPGQRETGSGVAGAGVTGSGVLIRKMDNQ